MENKNTVKKSFALLTTLLLVVLVSMLSISLVETKLLSSQLNSLKYLHLQAHIYLDTITQYVKTHSVTEIEAYKNNWSDTNFSIDIIPDGADSSVYYVSIQTSDETPVRLSEKILK